MRQWTIICVLVAETVMLNAPYASACRAEIIDRIAVVIGNQVITASDLEREIRVSAFLDRKQPDLSAENKRKAADRMVEQRLVRRELELSKYPQPEPSEVDPVLQRFKEENFSSGAEYQKALQDAGVTEKQVREHILWQLTLLRFIEVRFRPAVQVTEEEIREYFEKSILPILKTAMPGETVSLDDYRERMQEILIQQRVDKDLGAWIAEARKRVGVEFRPEVFKP